MSKPVSDSDIMAAIEKSMSNGTPLMIDYLPLMNTDEYFSKKESIKRKREKNNESHSKN